MSKVLVVVCLVALLFSVLVVPCMAQGPGGQGQNQGWFAKAKAKVWGSNGSNGAAARGAARMAKNGLSLPSGQAPWLERTTNGAVNGAQRMYQRTHQ